MLRPTASLIPAQGNARATPWVITPPLSRRPTACFIGVVQNTYEAGRWPATERRHSFTPGVARALPWHVFSASFVAKRMECVQLAAAVESHKRFEYIEPST